MPSRSSSARETTPQSAEGRSPAAARMPSAACLSPGLRGQLRDGGWDARSSSPSPSRAGAGDALDAVASRSYVLDMGVRAATREGSVPEVLELERDPEVLALARSDDGLQVVALLSGDSDLITLGL